MVFTRHVSLGLVNKLVKFICCGYFCNKSKVVWSLFTLDNNVIITSGYVTYVIDNVRREH